MFAYVQYRLTGCGRLRDAIPFSVLQEVLHYERQICGSGHRLEPGACELGVGPTASDLGVPSYHAYALKPPFPATLDPKQFPDALNRNVYALAAKIRPVLYQQPCYCYCDRHAGHKSLLDCFVGTHGSECDICQKEAVLSYQLTQKGKTPVQIRAAIIRGDWKAVNLNSYMAAANR
jgi:uncharacterized protein with PCYCGC motif